MKYQLHLLFLLFSMWAIPQSARGQDQNILERLTETAFLLTDKTLLQEKKDLDRFIASFTEKNGRLQTYDRQFVIEVHQELSYEIGEIRMDSKSFPIMFIWNPKRANQNIEFLIISEQSASENTESLLDPFRSKWIQLCNAHNAQVLVQELYTADAYYYNRGRLLQGTAPITQEYGYMNSPSYELNLTPKHIVVVNENTIYEIGRCSGSYPYPYLLLWKRQENGIWQIQLDSNY